MQKPIFIKYKNHVTISIKIYLSAWVKIIVLLLHKRTPNMVHVTVKLLTNIYLI